ncbi:PAQR family membrane homeostasis protein TrhA [Leptospira ognonensis]|nr:hemolysin III family protein [Leptospira ognonensis]
MKMKAKKSIKKPAAKKNKSRKKNNDQMEIYPPVNQAAIKELVERVHEYSVAHEIANAVTHGIGGALSIAGLTLLVTMAVLFGDTWRVVSSVIYGSTLVILYLASTLYHALHHEKAKFIFKNIDHASIFLLIAGTYTPFTLVSLRENSKWGWTLFIVIWALALVGVIQKAIFPRNMKNLGVVVYILMGWLCLFVISDIRNAIGMQGILWLLAGGLSYTFGVIFYAWDNLPFNHAIWHLFVLAGSFFHFFAIWFYVIPMPK